MPGREYSDTSYRFGFNGKEDDNDLKGIGNSIDYTKRIYDPRLGRFLSVDPLFSKYPWYTPYQFAGNKPIWAADLDGLEELIKTFARDEYKPVINAPDAATAAQNAINDIPSFLYNTIIGVLNTPANIINTIDENNNTNGGTLYDFVNQIDKSAVQLQNDLINDPKKVGAELLDRATDPASYELPAQIIVGGELFPGEKDIETPAKREVPNPNGSKGKPDHVAKVDKLVSKAKLEAKENETILREKKIQGHDSKRVPDVQIVNSEGKTRKTFEAERKPESKRVKNKESEYKKLGIDNETHSLDKH